MTIKIRFLMNDDKKTPLNDHREFELSNGNQETPAWTGRMAWTAVGAGCPDRVQSAAQGNSERTFWTMPRRVGSSSRVLMGLLMSPSRPAFSI